MFCCCCRAPFGTALVPFVCLLCANIFYLHSGSFFSTCRIRDLLTRMNVRLQCPTYKHIVFFLLSSLFVWTLWIVPRVAMKLNYFWSFFFCHSDSNQLILGFFVSIIFPLVFFPIFNRRRILTNNGFNAQGGAKNSHNRTDCIHQMNRFLPNFRPNSICFSEEKKQEIRKRWIPCPTHLASLISAFLIRPFRHSPRKNICVYDADMTPNYSICNEAEYTDQSG